MGTKSFTITAEVVLDSDNRSTKDRIIKHLEDGMYFKDACVLAGASEPTGHRWKKEDESFKSRVEAGIVEYKRKLISIVNVGSIKDARVALELLARRWPEQFGEKLKVTGDLEIEHKLSYDEALDLIEKNAGTKPNTTNQPVVGEEQPGGVLPPDTQS